MNRDTLETLRSKIVGCEAVALVDISTGTPLVKASVIDLAQEDLNALSHTASVVLAGFDDHPETSCLVFCPSGLRAFIRASIQSNEAICLLCGTTTSTQTAMSKTVSFLQDHHVRIAHE